MFEEALPRSGAEIGSIRGALLDGGAPVAAEGHVNIVPERDAAHDHGEIVVAVRASGVDVERIVQLGIAFFVYRHGKHLISILRILPYLVSHCNISGFLPFFTFCSHTVFHLRYNWYIIVF